mmetsp:Transcript_54068/g.136005  ORF Transcript_54068/g.136005 Transcript_54068/m.136005 type:complete len:204 (+) Transcript_54068:296-907(+)
MYISSLQGLQVPDKSVPIRLDEGPPAAMHHHLGHLPRLPRRQQTHRVRVAGQRAGIRTARHTHTLPSPWVRVGPEKKSLIQRLQTLHLAFLTGSLSAAPHEHPVVDLDHGRGAAGPWPLALYLTGHVGPLVVLQVDGPHVVEEAASLRGAAEYQQGAVVQSNHAVQTAARRRRGTTRGRDRQLFDGLVLCVDDQDVVKRPVCV